MKIDSKLCVLIDDDILVHMFWKLAASKNQIELLTFSNLTDFEKSPHFANLEKKVPVFVDLNLEIPGQGMRVAEKLFFDYGFTKIYLATGAEPEEIIDSRKILSGVCGKDPPF